MLLDDVEKEILRVKELNNRQCTDGTMLRREIDELTAETFDLRKDIDY